MSIPKTQRVPPYPKEPSLIQSWATNVAGFCNGAQAVISNNGINCIRVGSIIFLNGFIELLTLSMIETLPVLPRNDGYLTVFDSSGNPSGVKFEVGSKNLDFTGKARDTYYIVGSYFAA